MIIRVNGNQKWLDVMGRQKCGNMRILISWIIVSWLDWLWYLWFVIYLRFYVHAGKCWELSIYVWRFVATPEVRLDTEFTVLLVHVLNVSHPVALEGSSRYARESVERFIRKYTKLSPVLVGEHAHKFSWLAVDSRLDITIADKPSGFQAPSFKIYKYELSEGLSVIFEVEVRIIRRFISPEYLYEELDKERTDFLPQYWREKENTSCRVSSNSWVWSVETKRNEAPCFNSEFDKLPSRVGYPIRTSEGLRCSGILSCVFDNKQSCKWKIVRMCDREVSVEFPPEWS
jgi:hypothetical protein